MRRVALTLALVSAASASPPAAALAVRPPRLGNWEGAGSRGTAISFRLVRSGHRVAIGGGLTVTLPTSPVLCPAGPMEAAARHFERVSYAGPELSADRHLPLQAPRRGPGVVRPEGGRHA